MVLLKYAAVAVGMVLWLLGLVDQIPRVEQVVTYLSLSALMVAVAALP
jgi:hypothetical protein